MCAIYHLSLQNVGRGKGQSAIAGASYRSGEKLQDKTTGQIFDFSRKQRILDSEILVPSNAPDWMKDREELWNQVETTETKSNARFAREYNIALPHELTQKENTDLVKEFCKKTFTDKGLVVDYAMHESDNPDFPNTHAHLMGTTRFVDENGFTEKDREGNKKEALKDIRKDWELFVNAKLEKKEYENVIESEKFKEKGIIIAPETYNRIDCRTLKEQGIDREPQQHMGKEATAMERRGEETNRKKYAEAQDMNDPLWKEKKVDIKPEISNETVQIKDTPKIKELKKELAFVEKSIKAIDDPTARKELIAEVETQDHDAQAKLVAMSVRLVVEKELEKQSKESAKNGEAIVDHKEKKPEEVKQGMFNKKEYQKYLDDGKAWELEQARLEKESIKIVAKRKELMRTDLSSDTKAVMFANAQWAMHSDLGKQITPMVEEIKKNIQEDFALADRKREVKEISGIPFEKGREGRTNIPDQQMAEDGSRVKTGIGLT